MLKKLKLRPSVENHIRGKPYQVKLSCENTIYMGDKNPWTSKCLVNLKHISIYKHCYKGLYSKNENHWVEAVEG